jgi:hypothetical protein
LRIDAGNAVPKGFFGVNGHGLVGASQGGGNQGAPVLDQAMVYQATCAGERIEGCEVNVGDDADGNAEVCWLVIFCKYILPEFCGFWM